MTQLLTCFFPVTKDVSYLDSELLKYIGNNSNVLKMQRQLFSENSMKTFDRRR